MTWNVFAPLRRCAAVCACLLFAAPGLAASISYGDVDDIANGGVVIYEDVTESSATDAVPLFGDPDVTVDLLDFDPTAFGVSSNGGLPEITDGQLNFTLDTLPGSGIRSLEITEGGDYRFVNGGAGTTVGFDVIGTFLITEVNGDPLPPAGIPVDFSNSGSFTSTGALNAPSESWSLSVLVELGASLGAFGPGAVVTGGELFLNNTLTATSEATSLSFIQKKDFTITPDVQPDPDNVIPEPAAAVLVCLAIAGLASRRS